MKSFIKSIRLFTAFCLLPSALFLLTTDYWLLTTAAAEEPVADKEQIEKVREVAREYLNAFYKHDLDTVVRLTNPKLIESWGGPLKAKQVLLGPVQRVLAEGTEIIDLEFPEDPIFTHSDRNEFVLVPTKLWLINPRPTVRNRSTICSGLAPWAAASGRSSKARESAVRTSANTSAIFRSTSRSHRGV